MDRNAKKWFLMALTLSMLLGYRSTVLAAGIDIPAAVLTQGGYALGLEWGRVSRDIKFSDTEIKQRSHPYLAKLSYGLLNRLDLYGIAGAADSRNDLGFKGDSRPAFGGGIKLLLLKYNDTLVGLTGQAIRFTSSDSNVANIAGLDMKTSWYEYDMALGISRLISTQVGDGVVYAGVLLSKLNGKLESDFGNNPSQSANFKESHPIGFFLGGDLLGGDTGSGDRVRLGVEGRFITETSVLVKLSFAFSGTELAKY
ncbi:MAG: hypothetical protein HY203_11115 [Nitrospirae bacterium]|nr:hypothetical protein [Nitrospirota bacterium]